MRKDEERMLERIRAFPGDVGFYYQNLATGEARAHRADRALLAASVIKIPIMVEAFRQFALGALAPDTPAVLRPEDKVPPCGVLTFLHGGLEVTLMDLVILAIVVSDNTATNMLIDRLTMERINETLDSLGMEKTRLRRKMFDREAAARGIQNTIAAGEIGALLAGLYRGEVVSPAASAEMLRILAGQQLQGKMPFRLRGEVKVAHKTGEDDGITHDVGIVYAREPKVLCFCANGVDTPAFNRLIQDMTWEACQ